MLYISSNSVIFDCTIKINPQKIFLDHIQAKSFISYGNKLTFLPDQSCTSTIVVGLSFFYLPYPASKAALAYKVFVSHFSHCISPNIQVSKTKCMKNVQRILI